MSDITDRPERFQRLHAEMKRRNLVTTCKECGSNEVFWDELDGVLLIRCGDCNSKTLAPVQESGNGPRRKYTYCDPGLTVAGLAEIQQDIKSAQDALDDREYVLTVRKRVFLRQRASLSTMPEDEVMKHVYASQVAYSIDSEPDFCKVKLAVHRDFVEGWLVGCFRLSAIIGNGNPSKEYTELFGTSHA